jgi:uncharacterized protein YjdB
LVSIAPLSPKIWVPATEAIGLPLGKTGQVRLTATVVMDDHAQHDRVAWLSLNPAIATVDQTGLVTAVGMGEGSGPWSVAIKATADDGKASGIRFVNVLADGDVAVTVE